MTRIIVATHFLGLVVMSCAAGEGVQSDYYIQGRNGMVYVVRGTEVVNSFPSINSETGPLYVFGDIVCTADSSLISGGCYSLDGEPNGDTFNNPDLGPLIVRDAATDGTQAFAFAILTQDILKADLHFGAPDTLLHISTKAGLQFAGIAYDPTDNTLWLSGNSLAEMWQFDMEGNFIQAFEIAVTSTRALAFDPADQTLWFIDNATHTLYQYSRSGQLLDSFIPTGLPSDTNFDGGDINLGHPSGCAADFNGDGELDFFDVLEFLSAFAKGCP